MNEKEQGALRNILGYLTDTGEQEYHEEYVDELDHHCAWDDMVVLEAYLKRIAIPLDTEKEAR